MEREGPQTLTVFSSAKKGVQLINRDELQVDGKMYDIVKTITRNGIKYYYTTKDDDEDACIHKLAAVEPGASGDKSLPLKMLKLYEVKYVAVAKNYSPIYVPWNHAGDFRVNNVRFIYPSHFIDIFSPPPESPFS